MSRASGLHRLQLIDLEADRLRHRNQQIQLLLSDSAKVEELRSALTRSQEASQSAAATVRNSHNLVKDQRHKLKETEQKLYGGLVRDPKELQDLQAEAESLKRHLDTLEDRYLEAMLSQDQAEADELGLQQALALLESDQSNFRIELQAEQGQISQRLGDLEAEREAARVSVSEEDLTTYDKLRSRLKGVAVALLEEASCGACGLRVSASAEQAVRSAAELVFCGQCGRVLYGG